MRFRTIVLFISVLVGLDQMIKLIIRKYYFDMQFDIIPGLFRFYPKYNYDYSFVNNISGGGGGFIFHLILFIAITALLIFFYGYIKSLNKSKLVDYLFIFGISGALCAIISISFWEGVLDYVYLIPLFVFDLKDLYMNVFVVLCMVFAIKYHGEKDMFSRTKVLAYAKSIFVRNGK